MKDKLRQYLKTKYGNYEEPIQSFIESYILPFARV